MEAVEAPKAVEAVEDWGCGGSGGSSLGGESGGSRKNSGSGESSGNGESGEHGESHAGSIGVVCVAGVGSGNCAKAAVTANFIDIFYNRMASFFFKSPPRQSAPRPFAST